MMHDLMRPIMIFQCKNRLLASVVLVGVAFFMNRGGSRLEAEMAVQALTVNPHRFSEEMRYRRPADPSMGAWVRLFVVNQGEQAIELDGTDPMLVDGQRAEHWLQAGQWTWYDSPAMQATPVIQLPSQSLMVMEWNGARADWGVQRSIALAARAQDGTQLPLGSHGLKPSPVVFRAISFLGDGQDPLPHQIALHLENTTQVPRSLWQLRCWLPSQDPASRIFHLARQIDLKSLSSAELILEPGAIWSQTLEIGALPLGQVVIEARLRRAGQQASESIMARLRVRREQFDISAGWAGSEVDGRNTLTREPFLRVLRGLHLNTAQIGEVPGYTDLPELYDRYPLKRFHKLEDLARYGSDALLPQVHGVEFLGEPQYGGGKPVPPMEVHQALLPYRGGALPTTLTHSEERIWRLYAGLSDYPHYDAYRVVAPAADSWSAYDRWQGKSIRWGAPLETIGTMTRSLRDLYRPASIAYWSQGAHDGWSSRRRARSSPTPDELRMQAWQALANRITSLYWFNLSLESMLAFPDLLLPIQEVNRMALTLSPWLLEGVDTWHRRVEAEGRPQWDLSVVQTRDAALLFALNLDYGIDDQDNTFAFEQRSAQFTFPSLGTMQPGWQLFRLDRDGVKLVNPEWQAQAVTWEDQVAVEGVYIMGADPMLGLKLRQRWQSLLEHEQAHGVNRANESSVLASLQALLTPDLP